MAHYPDTRTGLASRSQDGVDCARLHAPESCCDRRRRAARRRAFGRLRFLARRVDRSARPGGGRNLGQACDRARRIPRDPGCRRARRSGGARRRIRASPAHIDAMRQAAFNTVADQGSRDRRPRRADAVHPSRLAARPAQDRSPRSRCAGADGYTLDIIQLADGQQMVRLRRKVGAGPNGIAALVPAVLFLPQVSTEGGPFSAYAHISTRDGPLIGEIGERPADAADARFDGQDEIRQIRLRRRNCDVARPDGRRPCRSEMARHIRHRRRRADPGRLRLADAAARGRQSGGRYRARARRRRIRALLPADRRYPLRPIARRRGAGALAQSRTARWCCPARSSRWRNRAG